MLSLTKQKENEQSGNIWIGDLFGSIGITRFSEF
ncbi:hypothetical protein C5S53_04030, partial [Methanophagales archaeon]